MRLWAAALVLSVSTTAMAEDAPNLALPPGPPLTAKAFDALTRGKVMETFDPEFVYGLEEFLPGQRSLWRDADGCMSATWEQVGDMICFRYEDLRDLPDCWVYKQIDGVIWGWLDGNPAGPVVRLIEGTSPMGCDWLGA